MAADAASFKTLIFSISFGSIAFKLPGIPSTIIKGDVEFNVPGPRIINSAPSAPGCPER